MRVSSSKGELSHVRRTLFVSLMALTIGSAFRRAHRRGDLGGRNARRNGFAVEEGSLRRYEE